jgi:hypothetical protein
MASNTNPTQIQTYKLDRVGLRGDCVAEETWLKTYVFPAAELMVLRTFRPEHQPYNDNVQYPLAQPNLTQRETRSGTAVVNLNNNSTLTPQHPDEIGVYIAISFIRRYIAISKQTMGRGRPYRLGVEFASSTTSSVYDIKLVQKYPPNTFHAIAITIAATVRKFPTRADMEKLLEIEPGTNPTTTATEPGFRIFTLVLGSNPPRMVVQRL